VPIACAPVEKFPITGTPIAVYPDLVVALACVKQATAANGQPRNSSRSLISRRSMGFVLEGKLGLQVQ
jgi:hypothetical protein